MGSRKVLLLLALLILPLLVTAGEPPARHGVLLEVKGPVGPATADYLHRAMAQAGDGGAELIVLQMDTPGGLASSMRRIIQDILASPLPVIGYVAPRGARAASAGTYILYACHIAAMAPATELGAATPISIGPGGEGGGTGGKEGTLHRKVVNDSVAYIRGLAKLHGRNADWAEKAVREAASLDAEAALKEKVIDLIAGDTGQLLAAIDGRTVTVGDRKVTLHSKGLTLVQVAPDWRSRLLALITDPNVAYILMLIGIYGLILEFSHPGTFLPGVAGAISLMLALYAFQVLPIDYAGLGLLLFGIALMVAEGFVPSFGALGIGGLIAFVIGSLMLIDTNAPGFGISLGLIAAVALFSVLLLAVILGMVFRARRRPVVSGGEEMLGASAEALEGFDHEGLVRVHGERWRARASRPVNKGERLRVVRREGLTLQVEPEKERED